MQRDEHATRRERARLCPPNLRHSATNNVGTQAGTHTLLVEWGAVAEHGKGLYYRRAAAHSTKGWAALRRVIGVGSGGGGIQDTIHQATHNQITRARTVISGNTAAPAIQPVGTQAGRAGSGGGMAGARNDECAARQAAMQEWTGNILPARAMRQLLHAKWGELPDAWWQAKQHGDEAVLRGLQLYTGWMSSGWQGRRQQRWQSRRMPAKSQPAREHTRVVISRAAYPPAGADTGGGHTAGPAVVASGFIC